MTTIVYIPKPWTQHLVKYGENMYGCALFTAVRMTPPR